MKVNSALWGLTLPASPVSCLPLLPALSLSTLASLSSATHLMFLPTCYSFCLRGSSSSFSLIISCHPVHPSLRVTSPGSLLRPPLLSPNPPKSGQTLFWSAFKDYIPFLVILSLVSPESLLCVVILFICLPSWTIHSKKAGLCSPFHPPCLEKDLVFRRGSRNTCGLNTWINTCWIK